MHFAYKTNEMFLISIYLIIQQISTYFLYQINAMNSLCALDIKCLKRVPSIHVVDIKYSTKFIIIQ